MIGAYIVLSSSQRDKGRMCEEMARFGASIDATWLGGNIRTLEGLLEEHEQTTVAPLESSTDDLFSVSLRSSVMENQSTTGVIMDLAASDEWEGLGTASSKASLDSLVAVDTHEAEDVPSHPNPPANSTPPEQGAQGDETSKILLSVAAIGAAAFGAFVASRSPPQNQTDRKRRTAEDNNTDADWVQVERRHDD